MLSQTLTKNIISYKVTALKIKEKGISGLLIPKFRKHKYCQILSMDQL